MTMGELARYFNARVLEKKAMQTYRTEFPEKSFISAYKEAGFKTYWLSNQIPFGEFDTPVSVFANESDVVQFMNLGSYSNKSSFDEILFNPFQHALKDKHSKKLIILHTLGNHWNYSRRYSKSFDRWRPSIFDMQDPDHTDSSLKTEINNHLGMDNMAMPPTKFIRIRT